MRRATKCLAMGVLAVGVLVLAGRQAGAETRFSFFLNLVAPVHEPRYEYRPQPAGHYEERWERVLVERGHFEGQWVTRSAERVYAPGRGWMDIAPRRTYQKVWVPDRYEYRKTLVWVPGPVARYDERHRHSGRGRW